MRVLIVDDSKILQERLYGLIEECEHVKEIHQAYNTTEAKKLLEEKNINIVVSDIRMPGGGGFDLLEFNKIHNGDIKTIIITNYPYPQYKEKSSDLGAEYFLSKSDELDKLIPVLNEIAASN